MRHRRHGWHGWLLVLLLVLLVPGTRAAEPGVFDPAWHPPMRLPSLAADVLARVEAQAADLDPLNSLLVAHRGTVVLEAYYRGMTPHTQVNIKSASKSILSALVGIALAEGYLDSLRQPIAPFFPEYFEQEDIDPRKRTITLEDLLTMRSGLETTSFQHYGAWVSSRDWVRDALDRPVVEAPGGRMIYSTGTSHLVSVILTKATGMSTLAFARTRLMDPLGIDLRRWDRDPQGYYFGGNNMALSPRELLRIGELYRRGGWYEGRRIVPEAWIRASTTPRTRSRYSGNRYGYFWWIRRFGGYESWFAWGYGGQYVFVLPALDLVVVCTASLNDRPRGVNHNRRIYDLLERGLLAAVTPAVEAERRWAERAGRGR
ncbi:MAG: class C beta-lactamase-related serine hydrolase [Bacteroidetes bacterium]|nr:MAG: class C beta-lactamase-related serine hydrolase [Bacteroidota bacterium]